MIREHSAWSHPSTSNPMKPFPIIKHSWGTIYRFLKMKVEGAVLVTAIKCNVFDCLSEPVAAVSVAQRLNLHPKNTELFLNALAGMDLLEKHNGLFTNTGMSNEFMVTSSPAYLGTFFCRVHDWYESFQSPAQMQALLKSGPGEQAGRVDDTNWVAFTREASAYQYCGPAQKIAEIVRSLPEFPRMNKMLDLGGGAGFYAMAIVSAHETMTGVVFDLPPVADISREFIHEYDAGDRVSVMAGDYTADAIGDGYDLILASGTLYFAKIHLNEIIGKIYNGLNPGGVFMSLHNEASHERTRPGDHICDFLFYELSGMDMIFTKGMIAETMVQCGFKSTRNFTIESDLGPLDIDIGKK
ncbi:methyltransferase [Desulfosarcina ovata]|nr:methyltransferase dimerization domain-containing protein [Desulfosarcina ovata]